MTTMQVSISPSNMSITKDDEVAFSVEARLGTPSYSYVWYKNGEVLEGETSATYNFEPSVEGMYTFYCQVTDSSDPTPQIVLSKVVTIFVRTSDQLLEEIVNLLSKISSALGQGGQTITPVELQ